MIKRFLSFLKRSTSLLGVVFFIALLLNIFSILGYRLNIILLFSSWFFLIYSWGLSGNISILAAIFFLLLAVSWSLFGRVGRADSMAARAFIFLIIGVAQILVELREGKLEVMNFEMFIKKIRGQTENSKKNKAEGWVEKRKYFKYLPTLIIVFSLFLFSPALSNFFSGDDWFHLNISMIGSVKEFLNFFSFSRTPQSAAFYRPLPTQVFFFVFHSLFGLSPLPYYLFVFAVFGFSLYLVYLFAKAIFKDENLARLSLFFYGISATNFTRVYFLSAFQELAMITLVLLSLLFYLKKSSLKNILFSLLFFVLALLSKETAVVLPFLLLLINWLQKKMDFKRIIPFVIVLGLYLYGRLFIFGAVSGESYIWDFSLKRAANTFFWYTLWSFGAPELLVDYVSGGLRILPRFFSDFRDWSYWSYTILLLIFTTLASFVYTALKNIFKIDRRFFFALAVFVLGLLPVLFLPWHKFTLELTLPMVGFSMMLAALSLIKKRLSIFVFLFFFLNTSTIEITQKTHYSVSRSAIARTLFKYFQAAYPNYPQGKYFEFINDTNVGVEAWGSSKQIAHVASQSNMFKVLYNDKTLEVFYEDFEGKRPQDKKKIRISSKIFLP